jgi:predicted amidohydrolase
MISVVGFMEEAIAAQFHNSAAALTQGEVAFLHRKLNLATYGELEEGKHFAEGRYFETFKVNHHRHWSAGILICADAWNPALVNLAAVHGTTVLLLPIASAEDVLTGGFDNPRGWDTVVSFYSMIYGLPTLMANHSAGASGLRFWGGSRIADAHGRPLALAGRGEELIVADLDYRALRQARYALPTLRDSNLDLVIRELNRLSWQIGIPPESRKL